jgi:hypothetical protein
MLTGGPEGGGDDLGASAAGGAAGGASFAGDVHATSRKEPIDSDQASLSLISLLLKGMQS